MKKIALLMLSVALCIISANAQKLKEGKLDFLKNEERINLAEFDFSSAKIDGKAAKFFFDRKNIDDPNWENSFKQHIRKKFIGGFFDSSCDLNLGDYPNASCTLILQIISIDDDNDVEAMAIFMKGNEKQASVLVRGKAGTFGSMTNLVGDACQDASKKLGKYLVRFRK